MKENQQYQSNHKRQALRNEVKGAQSGLRSYSAFDNWEDTDNA